MHAYTFDKGNPVERRTMAKLFYPDFFNDVFGPIMQPGSSGGFAGTCRVGQIARHALRSEPRRVRILFNPSEHHLKQLGNFMDDRGYLGGLLGFDTDDVRLFDAHEIARSQRISYAFGERDQDAPQRGAATFELVGVAGDTATVVAASIGGGMVRTSTLNGFDVSWQADTHALLIWATDQAASEQLHAAAKHIKQAHGDILGETRATDSSNSQGIFLESSTPFRQDEIASAIAGVHETPRIPGTPELATDSTSFPTETRPTGKRTDAAFSGLEYRIFPALLPVVTTSARKPQLFDSAAGWLAYADRLGMTPLQAAIEYEKAFSGWTENAIWDRFELIAHTLLGQIHSLEETGYENAQDTPNLPIYGRQWNAHKRSGNALEDPLTQRILDYAFSTNAKLPGTKIVPGPMGTGGGYLMSALEAVREARGFPHRKLVEGLIIAACLGAIAFTRTHPSGEAGCVGESGMCCAMASGAITWMAGGTGAQVERAASMALQANEGIPCDPIPGGKEFPCITRTVRAAVTAPLYADMALAGIDPLIPYDQVLDAIERNYRETPADKLCGSTCGINCTAAAQGCIAFLEGDLMKGKLAYEAPSA